MSQSMLRLTVALLVSVFMALPAAAQDINPESGDVWVPPEENETPPPAGQGASNQERAWYQGGATGNNAPAAENNSSDDAPSGDDDHSSVVGHFGVGFMGVSDVPLPGRDGAVQNVPAASLGVRYWLQDGLGIDVGLGLGYTGGNVSSGADSIPTDSAFGLTIHGGVPLALHHDSHFTFLVIPELNLGIGSGNLVVDASNAANDVSVSSFLLEVGARAGAEIQFGFMDVPNLSLQATVGLYFRYATLSQSNQAGTIDRSASVMELSTTVNGEPWDILTGSLTALYYF